MAPLVWVYAEVIDGRISRATLEMLSWAADLGRAEAILLGPAPDDAVALLSAHSTLPRAIGTSVRRSWLSPDPPRGP